MFPLVARKRSHSVVQALLGCFTEFSINVLPSKDKLLMNQFIIAKEHGLDIGLRLLHLLQSRRQWHLLCFQITTSDRRGHKVWIIFGLVMNISAQLTYDH